MEPHLYPISKLPFSASSAFHLENGNGQMDNDFIEHPKNVKTVNFPQIKDPGSKNNEGQTQQKLLEWVNELLDSKNKLTKILHLCKGSEYCRLMHKYFLGSIDLRNVNFDPQGEREYIHNLNILQGGLKKMRVKKVVPIAKLAKWEAKENLEFLKWFKEFFEAKYKGPKRHPSHVVSRSNPLLDYTPSPEQFSNMNLRGSFPVAYLLGPSTMDNFDELEQLSSQLADVDLDKVTVEMEKKFYFEKLRKIEAFCQDQDDPAVDYVIQKIFDILYLTEEGFVIPPQNDTSESDDLDED